MDPEKDLVTHLVVWHVLLLSLDHFLLLLNVLRVVTQSRFNQSIPVLGVQLSQLLLFFEPELELLVIGLHVEGRVVLEKLLNLQQSFVPLIESFSKKGDRLVQGS